MLIGTIQSPALWAPSQSHHNFKLALCSSDSALRSADGAQLHPRHCRLQNSGANSQALNQNAGKQKERAVHVSAPWAPPRTNLVVQSHALFFHSGVSGWQWYTIALSDTAKTKNVLHGHERAEMN